MPIIKKSLFLLSETVNVLPVATLTLLSVDFQTATV